MDRCSFAKSFVNNVLICKRCQIANVCFTSTVFSGILPPPTFCTVQYCRQPTYVHSTSSDSVSTNALLCSQLPYTWLYIGIHIKYTPNFIWSVNDFENYIHRLAEKHISSRVTIIKHNICSMTLLITTNEDLKAFFLEHLVCILLENIKCKCPKWPQ